VAVFVLGIVLTSQLLSLAFRPVEASDHDEFLVFSICFLSAIGVTAKLSFLASAFTISAAALVIYVARRRRVPAATGRRSILPVVAMSAAVVLVPHLTRNVVLSGYIMYPSTLGPFPVDWRIPEPVVRNAQNVLWGWARRPGVPWVDVLGNWNWLGPWAQGAIGDRWNVQAPAVLAVLGGLVLLYHAVTIGWTTITWRRWLLVLPVLLSIAFWFFTAPDRRFLVGSNWILGALILSLSVYELRRTELADRASALIICLSVAVVLLVAARFASSHLVARGSHRGFHPTPAVALRRFTTLSGLDLWIPERTGTDQTWDAPLPATPYPDSRLMLRRDGDLSSGFRLDPAAPWCCSWIRTPRSPSTPRVEPP